MNIDIEQIKKDIVLLSEKEFYFRYIIKSGNWYFSEYLEVKNDEILDRLDAFKEIVSKNFDVSFHSAQIVGSAKIGVSLSPNKPFRKFIISTDDPDKKESDIDIAIVSNRLFASIWEDLRISRSKTFIPNYSYIAKSIFRGYINDKDFKDIEFFRKEWEELISKSNIMLQDSLSITHPISYRVYRSWEDLEDYQLEGITRMKKGVII